MDFCEGDDAVTAEHCGGTLEMLTAGKLVTKGLVCRAKVDFPNKARPHTANRKMQVPVLRSGSNRATFRVSSRLARSYFACLDSYEAPGWQAI